MMKRIILIVIGAVGITAYALWNNWQKAHPDPAAPGRPTAAIADLRNINFFVNAAGEIAPAEQVSVRPQINGRVDLLPVDVGDIVKKGTLLFKLDDKELQQELASNLTDIDKAKLGLEKAERDYKRAQQLLAEKLISQEAYDNTKTAFELAKNALESSQRAKAITDEHLAYTVVRAPFDCTVLTRPVSMGQAVSGSDGFNGGTEVLTIADLNSMIINAQVNQADVPRLKAGEPVEVTVEAVADLQITGRVERVYPQATIKNNIKGYPARIVLKNVDPRVRPGMTANVKIPVASADNVTAVPLEAVFTEKNPDTGQMERFVYVQRGGAFDKRNVKVGISDFFYAEIQEGLKAGEIVSLELPKDEREKMTPQLAGLHPGTAPAPRPQGASSPGATNATNTTKIAAAGSTAGSSSRSTSAASPPVAARSPGNGAIAK
jgi:RND family efflux transporter MFP subunit